MQPRVDWVLIILGTQVIKKKQPVRPVFPGSLSVFYDYGKTKDHPLLLNKEYDISPIPWLIQLHKIKYKLFMKILRATLNEHNF